MAEKQEEKSTIEDKIFIGMCRPDWSTYENMPPGYFICRCGSTLQSFQAMRYHYEMGHMDYPISISLDEHYRRKEKARRELDEQSSRKSD